MKISVEYASPRHPDIKKLLLASHQLMRDLYPEETNSLKSFFVEPQFRGNGIASLIMQEILRTSRELNINSLKLETGIGLDNALNLYKRFNFELCEPFGKYFENGFSIFMKRDLP